MSQKVDEFLPVSRPEISDSTIDELVNVLKSGWIATGPKTQQFESDLSDFLDGRRVLTVTSNTVGLFTMLKSLGIEQGDFVITTPLTFAATVNAIELAGATPLFVDVDKDTFNIDINKIKEVKNEKVKAVIPVHYAGLPVDMDPLSKICKANGWRIIEDAAHAMGSSYKGEKIGSFGDIQVFSFHPIKNMTTGEGGCISVNSSETDLIKFVELFRFHGIDRSIWDRFSKKGKSQYYDVVMPGFKFNMSDIQSIIGIHQLQELESMNEKRRELMHNYRKGFANCEHIKMQGIPTYEHVHSGHLFPIVLESPEIRDKLTQFLKENNVGTTPYYHPVHMFSYYRDKYNYKQGDFPNAEMVGTRSLCIPLYPSLSEEKQMYVISKIKEFFEWI